MFPLKLGGMVRRVQQLVDSFFPRTGFPFSPYPQLAIAQDTDEFAATPWSAAMQSGSSFLESLKDGFVWGVPKKRVSLERRRKKQYGYQYMKPFHLKKDIIVCLSCGNYHQAHSVCGHCYGKVKEETEVIYNAMDIKARVADQQEVIILYEGETADPAKVEKKKVVQIPKPRPPLWFTPEFRPSLTAVLDKTGTARRGTLQ